MTTARQITSGSSAGQSTLIDALPYVDKEVDIPGLKELVKAEIDRELAAQRSEHSKAASSSAGRGKAAGAAFDVEAYMVQKGKMPKEAEMFEQSEHLRSLLELQADASSNPLSAQSSQPAIDPSKYVLPDLDQEDYEPSEKDWMDLQDKIRTGLGHMEVRNTNAALLSDYAPNHWRIRNFQLEAEAKEIEKEVEVWKEKVNQVNRERRLFQEQTGQHLAALEAQWQDLVTNTIQLEMANTAARAEVETLRSKAAALEADLEAR